MFDCDSDTVDISYELVENILNNELGMSRFPQDGCAAFDT